MQACSQELAERLHPSADLFVLRTNAAAVSHKIFIHDTCFIIRIDLPLLSAEVLTSVGHKRQSHEDEVKAGDELVSLPS